MQLHWVSVVLGCSGIGEPELPVRTDGLVIELSWLVGSWALYDGGCSDPPLGDFFDVDSLPYAVRMDVLAEGVLVVHAGDDFTVHTVETWQGPLHSVCTFCDATRPVSWMELTPALRFERWAISSVFVEQGGIHFVDGVQVRDAQLKSFECSLTFSPPGAVPLDPTFPTARNSA